MPQRPEQARTHTFSHTQNLIANICCSAVQCASEREHYHSCSFDIMRRYRNVITSDVFVVVAIVLIIAECTHIHRSAIIISITNFVGPITEWKVFHIATVMHIDARNIALARCKTVCFRAYTHTFLASTGCDYRRLLFISNNIHSNSKWFSHENIVSYSGHVHHAKFITK